MLELREVELVAKTLHQEGVVKDFGEVSEEHIDRHGLVLWEFEKQGYPDLIYMNAEARAGDEKFAVRTEQEVIHASGKYHQCGAKFARVEDAIVYVKAMYGG